MAESTDGDLVVRFPERVDRRSRLGPFPSAHDAAKFLCYAAAAALVAPWVSAFLWIPLVGIGFGISVWQPDGRPADERALVYVLWRFRRISGRSGLIGRGDTVTRHALVQLAPSNYLAVVRARGCPIAYLPPAELEQKFELYRDLLRASAGHLAILCTTVPIRATPLLPAGPDALGADQGARRGYVELASLLCRRRSVRRVYLALRNTEAGPDALSRLEAQASSMIERLARLGLRPVRLTDRALREAARRFDWSGSEADS